MRSSRFLLICSFVISVSILTGCDNPNAVHPWDQVRISYIANFEDGSTFENSGAHFTVGSGQVIPGLDAGVLGMTIGKTKTLTIHPNEGYGSLYTTKKIYKISRPIFDKLKDSLSGTFFQLGDVTGIYKWEETDAAGNVFALIDTNPRETWDGLVYKVTLMEKE